MSLNTEPIIARANIVTIISALASLLVLVGGKNVSVWLDENKESIALIIAISGPTVTALWSRLHTTSLAAPRDSNGTQLVPVGSVAALALPAPVEAVAQVDPAAVFTAAQAIHPAA